MIRPLLVRTVKFATVHAWLVIGIALLLTVGSGVYVARNFAINTDISRLLESDAPWAKNDEAISAAFPQRDKMILAVVQAPAKELADAAANELADALRGQPKRFNAVGQPGSGPFFERNGLLFADPASVNDMADKLTQARPLLNNLAHDPTLRGLSDLLTTTLNLPLQLGQIKLSDMDRLLGESANVVDGVLAGKPAALSWAGLVDDSLKPNADGRAFSFITLSPVLDYSDLKAGAGASDAIRATAAELKLGERYDAVVRLTGPQPLADDEFASVSEGAVLNGVLTLVVVMGILWMALRSARLITAVLASLIAGLIITAALGLMMVGALNMISVAFAVLFVGLGVDFGIQFGVRYRAERHDHDDLQQALTLAARDVAGPLTLAAAATAAAFFCFLPTDYRGVAELGKIAGVGMFVAFATTFTVLPALIRVLAPPGEDEMPGFAWLAPADSFFERHRKGTLVGVLVVLIGGAPLLPHLRFDFDPLHLKDPHSESMSTLLALKNAPQAGTDDVKVLAPTLKDAEQIATRLKALPEVDRVVTLKTFIPADQAPKLATIAGMAKNLMPVLTQTTATPADDVRRVGDVLRTLIPLLVSGLVTLELCVIFGISLNFANIIALPLLLGIGVAFKIYYVIAWRHGKTKLLQSSLTHAVLYSAATTATAFGSLWLSHHPGTASMGKLLALALFCTLAGAVFFQPILMGRPRRLLAGRVEPLGPSLPPLTVATTMAQSADKSAGSDSGSSRR